MVARFFGHGSLPKPAARLLEWNSAFRSINIYGLFAVMTTERPEIVVEGSDDGIIWHAYEFKWKPGDLKRPPAFVQPHQPRLDWQMWFAALGSYRGNPWFISFLVRLLQGSPEVLALLEKNPFPDQPPRFVRAVLYDYHFTDFATRRREGTWWRRERKGLYCPEIQVRDGDLSCACLPSDLTRRETPFRSGRLRSLFDVRRSMFGFKASPVRHLHLTRARHAQRRPGKQSAPSPRLKLSALFLARNDRAHPVAQSRDRSRPSGPDVSSAVDSASSRWPREHHRQDRARHRLANADRSRGHKSSSATRRCGHQTTTHFKRHDGDGQWLCRRFLPAGQLDRDSPRRPPGLPERHTVLVPPWAGIPHASLAAGPRAPA